MAWRAHANVNANANANTNANTNANGNPRVSTTPTRQQQQAGTPHKPSPTPTPARAKPNTIQAIAEIEKNREDRRRAMAEYKQARERENQLNEKRGQPGDVDFQRMIKAFRENNANKPTPHAPAGETKITICVRKRPVNPKEVKKRDYDAVTCFNPMAIVHDCKLKVDGITKYLDSNAFSFDHTFDESSSNELVYQYSAQPLVPFIFQEHGRATVFAYGQTGSGKTHTMQGLQRYLAKDLFAQVQIFEQRGVLLEVYLSFFEIYGGRCQDLLHRKRLTIREDGNGEVQIVDLQEVKLRNVEELLQVIQRGNSLRTTHATEVNDVSSRSHSICQINIREKDSLSLYGKLSLIDLAGSERAQDTRNHNRQRRLESSEINKSLLALKECIRALDNAGRNTHIPFRASKLTQVLKDSFTNAKARTVMIATVSPCSSSSDHTLNTLRYADRVKEKHVAADAFDGTAVVDIADVNFEPETDAVIRSPRRSNGVTKQLFPDGQEDQEGEEEDKEDEAQALRTSRSDSVSSQDDIRFIHHSLRRQSRQESASSAKAKATAATADTTTDADAKADYDVEVLHGVVQTLYEEQENLLNAHMNAIQESAILLTEEGALLAEIQGDNVVDYDIDKYVTRLDQILGQKSETIDKLRKQLSAFRTRCEEEENASKRVDRVPYY